MKVTLVRVTGSGHWLDKIMAFAHEESFEDFKETLRHEISGILVQLQHAKQMITWEDIVPELDKRLEHKGICIQYLSPASIVPDAAEVLRGYNCALRSAREGLPIIDLTTPASDPELDK